MSVKNVILFFYIIYLLDEENYYVDGRNGTIPT